jgi:hypothetical protein
MNEGLKIGHDMAEIAADNAGDHWKEEAYDAFVNYAKYNKYFTTEEVRASRPDIILNGDKRAWGAVAKRAHKNDIVDSAGWTRANSLTVHGMVVTKWKSNIFEF